MKPSALITVTALTAGALTLGGVAVAGQARTSAKACVSGKGVLSLAKSSGACAKGASAITLGAQGPAGAAGAPGADGTAGADGKPGTPGAPGANGLSRAWSANPSSLDGAVTLPAGTFVVTWSSDPSWYFTYTAGRVQVETDCRLQGPGIVSSTVRDHRNVSSTGKADSSGNGFYYTAADVSGTAAVTLPAGGTVSVACTPEVTDGNGADISITPQEDDASRRTTLTAIAVDHVTTS